MSHVYIDPAGPNYRPPNLIEELTRFRSTRSVVPEENQTTAALAWVLDRSPVFAGRFVRLFFDHGCLEQVRRFGTRMIVSLPRPGGGGLLYPDLSLVGDDRQFELLVEVKVGSAPHEYPVGEQVLLQPDMYLSAWRERPDVNQAHVRRVGTLTKAFAFPAATDEWRARDVKWLQVRNELRELIDSGAIEPAVVAVAADLVDVIGVVVLRERQVTKEHQDALVHDGLALLKRVRQLLDGLGKTEIPKKYGDYAGLYIRADGKYQLWLFVTPAGGRYNIFGNPDAVGIQLLEVWEKRYPDEARAHAGGFRRMRDLGGDTDDRIYIPLETEDGRIADAKAVADHVAAAVIAALKTCDPPLI